MSILLEVFAEGSLPERHTLVKKGTIFCEVFAEGILLERHTLVLEKMFVFGEVFAEGKLPERHTLILKKGPFLVRCLPKAAPGAPLPGFKEGSVFLNAFSYLLGSFGFQRAFSELLSLAKQSLIFL